MLVSSLTFLVTTLTEERMEWHRKDSNSILALCPILGQLGDYFWGLRGCGSSWGLFEDSRLLQPSSQEAPAPAVLYISRRMCQGIELGPRTWQISRHWRVLPPKRGAGELRDTKHINQQIWLHRELNAIIWDEEQNTGWYRGVLEKLDRERMLQRQSRGLKNTFWKEEKCDSRLDPGVKTRMPGPLEGGTVTQVKDTCVTPKKGGCQIPYSEKSFQFQVWFLLCLF